jgi:rhodanese-related sulfurtransferase
MLKQLLAIPLLCLAAVGARADIINISPADVARLAAAGGVVIDVRTQGEWQESGVIAGSKLITLVDESGRTDAPAWLAKVKAVARPEQAPILICHSGRRSLIGAQLLERQGAYKTIYNVRGGMSAWQAERRPVVAAPK